MALAKGQVLIVCTSCSKVGDRSDTGVWLSEVAVPYYLFRSNGYDVTIASLAGGEVPVDAVSIGEGEQREHPELKRFLHDDAAMLQLRQSVPLSSVAQPGAYACVWLAGGQGAMGDMPGSEQLKRVLEAAASQDRLITALDHGPAGLLGAQGPDGRPLLAGRTLACFTQAEEDKTGAAGAMPFSLEAKLKELGAKVRCEPTSSENALRDGNIVSGQNHYSAARAATLVLEALSVHPAGPAEPIVGHAAGQVAEV
ncbi:hypothetical protein HYH03_002751 [Edaphochlamys debaryana]|uniref:DJ-1/PfpI domain-containing protein n=1 Tax=Edaphochlamys debaryana TaxID=47281 RepID=A0A835YA46_9CHLO|nr:hypothetical protein HYH03_002751 [Edaphochlamys debaryana]|eukprot:KAG2499170.1 hypothetical protein HYH03_002751 [Edaphochlamys debaryana]